MPIARGEDHKCQVCGIKLIKLEAPCQHCHKPDPFNCWKHHNEICDVRLDEILRRRHDMKLKYLGERNP